GGGDLVHDDAAAVAYRRHLVGDVGQPVPVRRFGGDAGQLRAVADEIPGGDGAAGGGDVLAGGQARGGDGGVHGQAGQGADAGHVRLGRGGEGALHGHRAYRHGVDG